MVESSSSVTVTGTCVVILYTQRANLACALTIQTISKIAERQIKWKQCDIVTVSVRASTAQIQTKTHISCVPLRMSVCF